MQECFPMERGQLVCTAHGNQVELCMETAGGRKGLYRGVVLGQGGSMELGTLMPENGSLRLRRSLPMETLRKHGCWPVIGGRVELRYAFSGGKLPQGFQKRNPSQKLFGQDALLSDALKETGEGFFKEEAEGAFCLAFPWNPNRPFPMVPLFCFACPAMLDGSQYLLFRFGQNGRPILSEQ